MKLNWLRSAFAGLVLVTASVSALAGTYTVKQGDTLSKLRPHDWRLVCEQNTLANCGRIFVGQKLVFPDAVLSQAAKPHSRRVVQEKSCINLGAAPFNRYGTMELRLRGIDLNPELNGAEREEAKQLVLAGGGDKRLVTKDMVFKAMPFRSKNGQVQFKRDVKVCAPEQGGRPEVVEVWRLSTGKLVGDFETCGNVSVMWEPPKLNAPEPTSEPPTPVVTPPAPVTSTPEPASTPEPESKPDEPRVVTEAPKSQDMVCNQIDPAAVIGQQHGVSRDASHSSFATASLYCLKPFQTADGRTGAHGFGAKATYSNWHGSVNNHAGHYKGWNALAGLAYKRVMDEGTDTEYSVGPGKQVERYHEAAYASRREFDLVGVTVGHNDYRRRLAGETWDVERQYFGALTLPVGRRVGHTIFGQPLTDTAELGRFNFGFQAGARWWFYEDTDQFPLLPYVQGGLFVQHPTSASASARLGLSDQDRIVAADCGFDKDLQHGGDFVPACGWWLDVVRGITVSRTKFRKAQAIAEAAERGITVEEKDRFIQVIRFGEPPPK